MWTYEHSGRTTATPEAVWRVLRDVDNWETWDTSMQWVRLVGPFAVGSQVLMRPKGQDDTITSLIVATDENAHYADETSLGDVVLRFSHTLAPLPDGGTQVVHRLQISGPGAEQTGPDLGKMITEDFPEAMAALLARAEA